MESPQFDIESSQADSIEVGNEHEKQSISEGVDFLFAEHPELSSIGTKEQYINYVETIFPESKTKGIYYHSSDASFIDEGFKQMNPNFNTLNSIKGVFNFSSNRQFTKRYGQNTYAVVLDTHNPLEDNSSGEFADDMDRPLSEALYKIGKKDDGNIFAPSHEESLSDIDAVINHIAGEGYMESHPRTGVEWGIPKQDIVSVFDENKIHILGSKIDLQKFKEFVNGEK